MEQYTIAQAGHSRSSDLGRHKLKTALRSQKILWESNATFRTQTFRHKNNNRDKKWKLETDKSPVKTPRNTSAFQQLRHGHEQLWTKTYQSHILRLTRESSRYIEFSWLPNQIWTQKPHLKQMSFTSKSETCLYTRISQVIQKDHIF